MRTGYHGLRELEHAFYADVAGTPGRRLDTLPDDGDVWVGVFLPTSRPFLRRIPVRMRDNVQFYIDVPHDTRHRPETEIPT